MWSVVDRQVCVSLVSSEYAFEEIQPNDHLGLLKTCASWFCSSFPVGGVKERKYVPEVYTCSLFLPSRKDSAQAQAVGGGGGEATVPGSRPQLRGVRQCSADVPGAGREGGGGGK